jgi:hypothetical protein
MASVIQLVMLAAVAVAITGWHEFILSAALLLPMTNVLVFGTENLVFLLFPTRMTSIGTGDMQAVGRQMLLMLLKLVVLLIGIGLAAAFGGLAWLTIGRSMTALLAGAAAALFLLGAALIPCVGFAFRRFDPSRDMPE